MVTKNYILIRTWSTIVILYTRSLCWKKRKKINMRTIRLKFASFTFLEKSYVLRIASFLINCLLLELALKIYFFLFVVCLFLVVDTAKESHYLKCELLSFFPDPHAQHYRPIRIQYLYWVYNIKVGTHISTFNLFSSQDSDIRLR